MTDNGHEWVILNFEFSARTIVVIFVNCYDHAMDIDLQHIAATMKDLVITDVDVVLTNNTPTLTTAAV